MATTTKNRKVTCGYDRGQHGTWFICAAVCLVLFMVASLSSCAGSQKRKELAENHLNIGKAYVEGGDYTAAIKELLEAEKYAQGNPKIHYYLAVAYFGKGYSEKAVEECEKAVSLKPDYSTAYHFLGILYYDRGQYDKAIAAFNSALTDILYETPDLSLYNMGRAYASKGDYQRALTKYQEAVVKTTRPELIPLIEKEMGKASYAQGDIDGAISHFKKSTELVPNLVESYFWLGECYSKQKRISEARRAYEMVVKLAPASDFGLKAKQALKLINI
ncbi:MAG: tetratricopeptide repeat protein [Syntrophus sp. (in: bacteria)]